MAVTKVKSTSTGRRGMVCVVEEGLYEGMPYTPLLEKKSSTADRNNNGHITIRHKGSDHKHHYRVVDFKCNKNSIPVKVKRIEYDPNRTTFIALLCYANGERRCIITPHGTQAGAVLASGAEVAIKVGNTLPIHSVPVGATIHYIEMKPGKDTQITRSTSASAVSLTKEGAYAQVRLRSGEVRKINVDCRATISEAGSEEQSLKKIGKAGANRWHGIRPTVRGIVMNPIDHPHGGDEDRTGRTREPVSPWDTSARGYRTHNSKRTDNMIVCRRYSSKG